MNSFCLDSHEPETEGGIVFAVDVRMRPLRCGRGRCEKAAFDVLVRYEDGTVEEIYDCLLLRRGAFWKMLLPPQTLTLRSGRRIRFPAWLPHTLYERVRREAVRHVERGDLR